MSPGQLNFIIEVNTTATSILGRVESTSSPETYSSAWRKDSEKGKGRN